MADIWFDVDAALSEVPVNIFPLTDDTDFKTRETSVAYNATGMDLVWNFVTTAGAYTQTAVTPTTGGAYDWAHQGDGMYSIEIPASGGASINNDTEGFGWFTGMATGVLPWRSPVFGFRAAGINNLLIDDAYSVTRGLAGTALPAAAADSAGGLPISDAGALDLDTQLATLTNGTYGLSAIETLVDDLESRLTATRAGYLDNLSEGAVALASVCTEARLAELGSANLPADIDTLISRLTALRAGYLDKLNITGDVAGATPLATMQGNVTDILADTNELQTDMANGGRVDLLIDAVLADTAEIQAELADGGRTDLLIDAILADTAEMQAELADGGRTDLILDAILGDTAELQTDWANGGRLDLLLDAAGAGGDATEDKQDTIIAAIGALNDISTSDVLTQAASALNTYDPPTKAELDVAIAAVAGLAGSYAMVITVQDGSSNNVIAANVEVWDSGNTTFYQRLQTNSSGQVTFNMDAGTYTIRIYRAGYTFADATLVISGAGSTTYNMTPFTTPTASNVSMCRVYGYFMTPTGGYYATLTPSAVVEETYDSSNNFFKGDVTGGYVAASGLVYWDIVQGATARIRIPEIGYEAQIIVPDASSSKLDDLV